MQHQGTGNSVGMQLKAFKCTPSATTSTEYKRTRYVIFAVCAILQVSMPHTGEPVDVRIGIHSGTVHR